MRVFFSVSITIGRLTEPLAHKAVSFSMIHKVEMLQYGWRGFQIVTEHLLKILTVQTIAISSKWSIAQPTKPFICGISVLPLSVMLYSTFGGTSG